MGSDCSTLCVSKHRHLLSATVFLLCFKESLHYHVDCLEHKPGKYIPSPMTKKVLLPKNQYASYAILTLAGSMYLPGLCSKQLMCAFQVKASQLAKSEVDFSFKLKNVSEIKGRARVVGQVQD